MNEWDISFYLHSCMLEFFYETETVRILENPSVEYYDR